MGIFSHQIYPKRGGLEEREVEKLFLIPRGARTPDKARLAVRYSSVNPRTAAKVLFSLAAGDTLVDQDFDLDPPVLGPPRLSLVRCR